MKSSIAIKSILASFLNSLGMISWKLTNHHTGNNFILLMYHRVILKNEDVTGTQAGMYVDPETFETHLRFLKQHFNIVPLSSSVIARGPEQSERTPKQSHQKADNYQLTAKKGLLPLRSAQGQNDKPPCILTFDDGWYDFYKYAFPILKTYRVPATVFLPTDFIGTRKWFWTDRLTNLFVQRKKVIPPNPPLVKGGLIGKDLLKGECNVRLKGGWGDFVSQLEKFKGSQETQLEKAIQMLKAYREEEIEEILSELSIRWNLNSDLSDRAFLSWEEVREMKQSGLISFGSHTASHRILTTLTDKEIKEELIKSKERLIAEKVVDPSFIPFSYPNGNYNEKIDKMVKEAGYSLAVTTDNGWNNSGANPFTLKRIAIHQDMTSTEAMFGCRITNIF